MAKVVFFSDLYLPTFPFLDLPLFSEVKKMGIDVEYLLRDGDIRTKLPGTKGEYEKIATMEKDIKNRIKGLSKKDLLVCRFGYKDLIGKIITIAVSKKVRVLALDSAAVDVAFRECRAQYLTLKSSWIKHRVVKKFPKRKKNVFTTGTIHFDSAYTVRAPNKREFMKSYGLNPDKKLAILCKASAGEIGHQKGVDLEYRNIVNIVKKQCPGYELLLKCHPLDHLAGLQSAPGVINKNIHYKNRPSWLSIFPEGIKVIKPEEGYAGFKCCDIVLNVRSSIGMETALFPVPLININSQKYLTNWPRSTNPGVMKFVDMNSLAKTLNEKKYYVDKNACKKYVLEFCDPAGDGKAYVRTAKIIKSLAS